MKKLFILLLVFLLAACSVPTSTPERESMQVYTSYLTRDYVGVYEPSSRVDGYSYAYVGNNSSGTGFYFMLQFGSDFPYDGSMIGDYEVTSEKVTSAILRLPEVNGYRGDNPLTLWISPITGAWNPTAAFNSLPAYSSAVKDTYSNFATAPSSSNYNYRDDPYTQYEWLLFTTGEITWSSTSPGTYWRKTGESRVVYTTYVIYHNINITNVIKNAIDNNATGIILYFDLGSASNNRKVFETAENIDDNRKPLLTISFDDTVTNPPVLIAPTKGSINKQVLSVSIAPVKGAINKQVVGMMIAPVKGAINKTIF